MKTIGGYDFPETREESINWRPRMHRVALHSKVLVVAKLRYEGAWSAYCFPVLNENHDDESYLWKEHGSKLGEELAKVLFPYFKGIPYVR